MNADDWPHSTDDFACFDRSREELRNLLLDALVASEAREIDRPRVVIQVDHAISAITVHGPYPDALGALLAAHKDEQAGQEDELGPLAAGVSVTVAPLIDG